MSGRRHSGHKPVTLKEHYCLRKHLTYASERRSLIAAQMVANRDQRLMAVYRCPHCKNWHMNSNEQRNSRYNVRPQDPVTAQIFRLIHYGDIEDPRQARML